MRHHLSQMPRVIILSLIKGTGFRGNNTYGGLSTLVGETCHVKISSIAPDGSIFSCNISSSKTLPDLVWNEQHLVCVAGAAAFIVISVLSRNIIGGERIIGQVVLDLEKKSPSGEQGNSLCYSLSQVSQSYLPGESYPIHLPITGNFPFPAAIDGNFMDSSFPHKPEDQAWKRKGKLKGALTLQVCEPSQFTCMCGWFHEITTSLFGIHSTVKIWIAFYDDSYYIYNSNKMQVESLVRTIRSVDIRLVDRKRFYYPPNSPTFERINDLGGVEILLASGERLIWAWSEESLESKGMWLRCLSENGKLS